MPSLRSTQNAVLAAPPHAISPSEQRFFAFTGIDRRPRSRARTRCRRTSSRRRAAGRSRSRSWLPGQVVLTHVVDGARAEDAHAVEHPVVEDHLREAHVVVRGADEAAASAEERRRRCAAAAERRQRHGLPRSGSGHVERGEAVGLLVVAPERGVAHAERRADALLDELTERLTGHDLDDPTEHVGRHRVVPLRAGLEQQRDRRPHVARAREIHSRGRSPLEPGLPVQVIDAVRVHEAVREARRVREQVVDRHRLRLGHGRGIRRRPLR